MKTILKTLFIATVFILSCNKHDKPAAHSWIVLSKYSLTETQAEGKDTILVSSNIEIKLNVLPPYLKASIVNAGEQQYKIILSFTANTDTSIRNCTINISGKRDSILPVALKFIQAGTSPFIFINNSTRVENPEGQLDSVTIVSNISWHLDVPQNASWITASKNNSGPGTSKIFFTIDTNKVIQVRKAGLTISNPDGVVTSLLLNISQDIDYHISDVNPLSGTPGNVVTIKGIFGADPIVKVNGVVALTNAHTETEISFMLPPNASTGKITVSFNNRTITSKQDFTYYNYFISNFSPDNGTAGTHVTINGSFGPNLKLKLNGQDVPVDTYSPSQVSFTVPPGATTGKLVVTSGAYAISSDIDFIVTN